MDNNKIYTKGDKDFIIGRTDQIHTITMYCPLYDMGVCVLRDYFERCLSKYKIDESIWNSVPAIDALNAFIYVTLLYKSGAIQDSTIIGVIASSLKSFPKLKKINFEFTDNEDIAETYRETLINKKINESKTIYKLEVIEMNLSNMFSQDIIDIINKVMMLNNILSNSYLDRKFTINFKYDEYINFMDMFLGNNAQTLNNLDKNICDYFRLFPSLVDKHKPDIKIITNYREL